MRRIVLALAASAALFLVLFVLGALGARVSSAGWWDDLDKGRRVRLADVVAQPAVTEEPITFLCVFHKIDAVYFPYFTHFSPEKHVNLAVWNDGAQVWEKDAFMHDEPFLYLPRDHAQRDELARLPMFTRIEVTGRVRDVYRESPWIEVLGFRKTGGTLGERVVQEMMSGDQLAAQGDSTRAEAAFRRALEDPSLDEGYGLRMRKRYGDLLRSLGREDDANEVEGGGILSGNPSPRAVPGAAPAASSTPGAPGVGDASSAGAPPAPAAPTVRASPITTDLPGVAVGPTSPDPTSPDPASPDPASPGSAPIPKVPPFVDATPGAPPPTPPATPDGTASPPPAPPIVAQPAGTSGSAPPKRNPRLAGVK